MNAAVNEYQYNEEEPQRLDHFLAQKLPDHSRSQIQRLIKTGQVVVDGQMPAKTGLMLTMGNQVRIEIPPPEPLDIQPEDINLPIIFEDENVLVVNKPAGMVVHPSAGHSKGTLVHAALAHSPFLAGIGGKARPGIVHRLDKNTSGVILIAKNDASHKWLQEQFKNRKVEKKYYALVDGRPKSPTGRIIAPIMRDKLNRKKMTIAPEGKGRYAQTDYHTVREFKSHTYLDVHPLTGRTHQIRVHLASIDCPIAADTIYGYRNPSISLGRHFLHAYQIRVCLLDEKEPRTFIAELTEELSEVLAKLF